jgi:hypothetical protein
VKELVVTVHANGSLETLLKDGVFDTRQFGDRKIERVSVIEHDESTQHFYIKWLKGPYAGMCHTFAMATKLLGASEWRHITTGGQTIASFETYDDAVEHEIACVNALRLAGHSFA